MMYNSVSIYFCKNHLRFTLISFFLLASHNPSEQIKSDDDITDCYTENYKEDSVAEQSPKSSEDKNTSYEIKVKVIFVNLDHKEY